MTDAKQAVHDFWERSSCGEEAYARGESERERLEQQARVRYQLEPYILGFARFAEGRDRDVLEVGVGMGSDHLEWARARPRRLCGIDLTERAVEHTRRRLEFHGLSSELRVADAEALPFDSESFDLVYSWGVLHHSPDTPKAIGEVHRVLRRGGTARIMIYHSPSLVGWMLWSRYALLAGRPFRSLSDIYSRHLESPGTKAFSVAEARKLFDGFYSVSLATQLSVGDLLEGAAGQRHQGAALKLARAVYPRALIRRTLRRFGLFLMIEAVK